MTDANIELIERELGIVLPESYKRAVMPFGLPALIGNTAYQLWDDAQSLIALNRELHSVTYSRWIPAWPGHFYAVGDRHGDEMIAVALRDSEGPVWWPDHGFVEHESSSLSHDRFSDWVEEFFSDIRHDLNGDGYDPDKIPEH